MAEKEYSRAMSNMRGIDATSEASNVALNRFSRALNMYKDYKSGQGIAVETFPGTRTLADLGGKVYGIHHHKDDKREIYAVVHAGNKLIRFRVADRDTFTPDVIYDKMGESHSSSFVHNNNLYITDGVTYVEVDSSGKAREISASAAEGDKQAYIPTTFTNGIQYEQRNMLTNKFKEKMFVPTLEKLTIPEFNTSGELYETIDGKVCRILLTGASRFTDSDDGNEYEVPYSYINIYSLVPKLVIDTERAVVDTEGDSYEETSVEQEWLNAVETISMNDNITDLVGTFEAFGWLKDLDLSESITSLPDRCFANTNINTIALPIKLKDVGSKIFDGCPIKTIEATEEICEKLKANRSAYGIPDETEIVIREAYTNITTGDDIISGNRVYIYTPCESIERVEYGGVEIPEYATHPDADVSYTKVCKVVDGKVYIMAIELMTDTEGGFNNTVYIHGTAYPSKFKSATAVYMQGIEDGIPTEYSDDDDGSIYTAHDEYTKTPEEAIKGCKVVCTFDDRVFFTGNPDLPNTVFYTQRDLTGHANPTYFGQLNWFDDGVGNEPNVAMMSNATTLMVLKGNTIQDGSIYYHIGSDGGNDITPRIYPSTEGLAGLGCVGLAVNFRDDCCFMSGQGLEGVSKQTVNLERTIGHRSSNIDGLLLQHDLSTARAAEWEGYLCILVDGKMFLADSRQMFEGINGIEYEWYYVDPVGAYIGDNKKYVLSDWVDEDTKATLESEGIFISDNEDKRVAYSDVKSKSSAIGELVYYVERDGVNYLVEHQGEYEGGTLDKACEISAIGEVLIFGTESGKLLCLNNDKRGTNEEEPDKSRIPTKWYNNSNHAYASYATFAMENAGVPHYTKATVKRGTVLRLKTFASSSIEVNATTDRQSTTLLTEQSNTETTFDEIDFANLGLLTSDSAILAIKEKTKKWVEKQYQIIGKGFNMPWGFYSITYRFFIQGEVKNK